MMPTIYPCCDSPSCSMCHGSGIAEGPEADAVMAAIEALPPAYDAPQDDCPECGSGSYSASPFGAAWIVTCAGCGARWIEPLD